MHRLVLFVGFFALLVGCGTDSRDSGDGEKLRPVSVGRSTVKLDRTRGVISNGEDAVVITVTVRDEDGQPISGRTVVLAATGEENILDQPPAATDAQGIARGALRSRRAEEKIISASVRTEEGLLELSQDPAVVFVPAK